MKIKILYVEDEPFLGKIVSETLEKEGFDVILVADGALVIQQLSVVIPDICVLDIMLPNVDGYSLCRKIKDLLPQLPVIFLTARTEIPDLVKGFEAGGTDYIRKPFSMEELIIRINNQLNLAKSVPGDTLDEDEKPIGKYRYLPGRYELHTPSKIIRLSQREKEVLNLLVIYLNQAIDRKHILQKVWKDDSFFNSRTLDVYIRKLRSYFQEDPNIEILTLKGQGYLFLVR